MVQPVGHIHPAMIRGFRQLVGIVFGKLAPKISFKLVVTGKGPTILVLIFFRTMKPYPRPNDGVILPAINKRTDTNKKNERNQPFYAFMKQPSHKTLLLHFL